MKTLLTALMLASATSTYAADCVRVDSNNVPPLRGVRGLTITASERQGADSRLSFTNRAGTRALAGCTTRGGQDNVFLCSGDRPSQTAVLFIGTREQHARVSEATGEFRLIATFPDSGVTPAVFNCQN